MKFQIQILEEVYLELEEAADYYYLIRPGLEQELFKDWLESLKRIKNAPEAYQKQKNNFRQVLLNKFPFVVIYEVMDSTIIIYRFINAYREPGKRYKKRT